MAGQPRYPRAAGQQRVDPVRGLRHVAGREYLVQQGARLAQFGQAGGGDLAEAGFAVRAQHLRDARSLIAIAAQHVEQRGGTLGGLVHGVAELGKMG
jgi:hypothetical protein